MAGVYGKPFVHCNPQQRFLSDRPMLDIALKELSQVLHDRLYSLDLASIFIMATQWQDVYELAAMFLQQDLVQQSDLGMNCFPPLQSVIDNTALLNKFKAFGPRLSLGLDGTPYTGDKETDDWIAYGRGLKKDADGFYDTNGHLVD